MSTASDTFHALLESERQVAERIARQLKIVPPHPNDAAAAQLSLGDRIADRVAAVAGSWTFILIFTTILGIWMAGNVSLGTEAFDPYPFILLNLLLSTVAALQAPVIMMSQNRQAARDRLQADLDYKVNVQAEGEIVQLKTEMEELRRQQLAALMAIHQEQLALLRHLTQTLPHPPENPAPSDDYLPSATPPRNRNADPGSSASG